MSNKVEFGISNLHVGTYSVATDGTVTLGTPYHVPGAVSWNPDEDSENNVFYADNIAYWSEYTDGDMTGDLVVAKYPDVFKTMFMGYLSKGDGGLAKIKNAVKPKTYIAYQVEGDVESRRVIMYNCALGSIKRENNTIEGSKSVDTEALAVSVAGDNKTGIVMVSYYKSDTGYSTLFTSPPTPTTT